MSENDRKRRSKWDNKEDHQISTQTNERDAWQERESYPRHPGNDTKSYDLEPDDVMNSRDFPERPSREPSPGIRDHRDANRDSSDISRIRRPGDVAKSYPVSPRNHEPDQQNHFHSLERTRDYSRRRSRSWGRGRDRSHSPSGDRNTRSRSLSGGGKRSRSPSPSRGRERDRGYGRSGSPPHDYRRNPHGPSGGRNRSRSPSGGRNRSRSPSPNRGRGRDIGYGQSGSPPNDYRRGPRGPSGGWNRSKSPSPNRGRERDRGYGWSGSPPNDYRRDLHGGLNDRRSGFRGPPPQVCRNFTAGDCKRGSQCRFLHPDNPNPRDGGRSERDQPEKWGQRGERGGSRYDVEREVLAKNRNPYVCNDFLKGKCHRGSSCRFSHDASGEKSHERQHHIDPCKFFMMGNCSRANCKFAHDAPMQGDHKVVPRDDRRNREHGEKNSTWNGPTWDEAEKSDCHSIVKDGGRSQSTLDDVVGGSDVGEAMGWGDRGTQNLVKTEPVITQRDYHDEQNHLDKESEKWNGPDSHDLDMEIAGSEAPNEITEVQPHSTLDSMQYLTPYEFSKPTSTATHSEFPENSQLYGRMEENVSTGRGFDSVNVGNVYGNAKEIAPVPRQDFDQHLDAYSLPPQQFSGIGQGQLVNSINPSDGHNVDYNGPVQENISHFKLQNSTDSQHGVLVNPVTNLSMPQVMEHKTFQISNLPPMTEKFVNEQLPQLYAVLNPPKPAGAIPSNPESVNLFPPVPSINTQPDQTSIYHKRNNYGIEPKELDDSDQYQGFSSNSIIQNDCSVNNTHTSSQPSLEKPVPEEPTNPIAEKPNQEAHSNGAGNVEADKKDGDGGNLKDEKAMRLFKNSLVEFVKDILKPKWKEGGMSRDVYKSIVKKVVDKVIGATQGVNIPSTQTKLDQYLESSRPKLAKLVEAYVERYAKTS